MVCVSGRHGNGHRPDAPINVHALAERLHRRKRTQAAHKQFESSLYYTSRTLLKLSVICSEAIQKALPTLRITRGSVHYLSARHQGHDPHAARCRAARGPPCHVAASFRAQVPEACTRRLARGASELAASLPPLADAPRCSCSLGLLALILLYRRRKSRHAPNEAAAELDRRTTRDAIDDGHKHGGLSPSPYDHRATRSTVLFNGRSPDHHKKSPGKVSPSPSSAAAVGFLCVGRAATAGASSSTCGQARRVCASAAALGWGGGCSAPAVHHPSTPPHCTSWGRRLVPFLVEAPKTCARTALKRRSVGSSRPAGGDPRGSLDAACRAAVPRLAWPKTCTQGGEAADVREGRRGTRFARRGESSGR